MFEIIKGTCFFIYCPFLPLWWIVEFAIEQIKRKIKKKRRRAAYRRAKVKKMKGKAKEFLSMDDYVRGKTTKKKLKRGKRKWEERLEEEAALQPTLEDMEDGFNDLDLEEPRHSPPQQQGKAKQKKRKRRRKQSIREREHYTCSSVVTCVHMVVDVLFTAGEPSLIAEGEVMLHPEVEGRSEEPLLQQEDLINKIYELSDGDEVMHSTHSIV